MTYPLYTFDMIDKVDIESLKRCVSVAVVELGSSGSATNRDRCFVIFFYAFWINIKC